MCARQERDRIGNLISYINYSFANYFQSHTQHTLLLRNCIQFSFHWFEHRMERETVFRRCNTAFARNNFFLALRLAHFKYIHIAIHAYEYLSIFVEYPLWLYKMLATSVPHSLSSFEKCLDGKWRNESEWCLPHISIDSFHFSIV